jgi:hypothetical protein
MKEVTVRWSAFYETKIQIKEGMSEAEEEHAIARYAANIDIEVEGSEYQEDTWEVEETL